jgi:uncharacterized OsmC-like protein
MITSSIQYQGDLKVSCTHLHSETLIESAAPVDNAGDGSSFSPTDLLATSLAACAVITLAIKARANKLDIGKPQATVTKVMTNNPRRVAEVAIELTFDKDFDEKDKNFIQETIENCPVALSLNSSLKQTFNFMFRN